jgi:hypothetical protein
MPPNRTQIATDQDALLLRLNDYSAHRLALIRRRRVVLTVCTAAVLVGGLISYALRSPILFGLALLVSVFSYAFTDHVGTDQSRLIKLAVAKRYGWLYLPLEESSRTKALVDRFPDLFASTALPISTISDQLWGTYGDVPFWKASFFFSTQPGTYKYRDRTRLYTLYAFPARRPRGKDILIWSGNVLSSLGQTLSSEACRLGSAEFSSVFSMAQTEGSRSPDGMATMTPAEEAYLLGVHKTLGPFTAYLGADITIFAMDQDDSASRYTDVLKTGSLDARDVEAYGSRITNALAITSQSGRLI